MMLYEAVKNTVTTLQAAERYGLKVGRGGMCKCPLPSLLRLMAEM